MATVSGSFTGGATSGTSDRSASVTPAVGDLLIVFCSVRANTNTTPTCSDDQGGTYTLITAAEFGTNQHTLSAFVRDSLVSAAVSHTVTVATGSNPSGNVGGVRVASMSKSGATAIRQSAKDENNATSTTPAATFTSPGAVLTGNVTIGAVGNGDNPATMTPPAGWTEQFDIGQPSSNIGLEVATRDSGFTGTTITWGSASSSVSAAIIVELDTSSSGVTGSAASASDSAGTATGSATNHLVTGSAASASASACAATGSATNHQVTGSAAGTSASSGAAAGAVQVTLSNSFEGGTSGTAITAANSGGSSGDAFDAVTGTSTPQFSNAHPAHGSIGMALQGGGAVEWQSGSLGTPGTVYGRAYLYLTSAPGVNADIARGLTPTSTNARQFTVRVNSGTPKIALQAKTGTVVVGSTTLSLNTLYRVEFKMVVVPSGTCTIDAILYLGDSATPLETLTQATATGVSTDTSINQVWFGSSNAVSANTVFLDDVNANTVAYPGPVTGGGVTGSAASSSGSAGSATGSATNHQFIGSGSSASASSGVAAGSATNHLVTGSAASSSASAGAATGSATNHLITGSASSTSLSAGSAVGGTVGAGVGSGISASSGVADAVRFARGPAASVYPSGTLFPSGLTGTQLGSASGTSTSSGTAAGSATNEQVTGSAASTSASAGVASGSSIGTATSTSASAGLAAGSAANHDFIGSAASLSASAGVATGSASPHEFIGSAASTSTSSGAASGSASNHQFIGSAVSVSASAGSSIGSTAGQGTAVSTSTSAGVGHGRITFKGSASSASLSAGLATGTSTNHQFMGSGAGQSNSTGAASGTRSTQGTAAAVSTSTGTALGRSGIRGTAISVSASMGAAFTTPAAHPVVTSRTRVTAPSTRRTGISGDQNGRTYASDGGSLTHV